MLFGCSFSKRLEPVGDMGYPMFHSPGLHSFSHLVGYISAKSLVAFYTGYQGIIGRRLELLAHLVAVEDAFAEIFRGARYGGLYVEGLFLEGILNNVKSKFAHNLSILIIFTCYFSISSDAP